MYRSLYLILFVLAGCERPFNQANVVDLENYCGGWAVLISTIASFDASGDCPSRKPVNG